jgi:electron transfer flavoprotein beta subunit
MKIIVCVKRVAHTAARIRPAAGSGGPRIQTDGVEFTMSPYDEIALAEAVRIQEKHGGEIIALSLGGDESQAILRTALAMGADSGIHLRAAAPIGLELDGFQVASAIAGALRERHFDLLLFGRLAVDDQSAQVGTLTARLLKVPSVADVTRIEVGEGRVRLHHLVEGRVEVVECPLPAAVTAQKGLAEPKYPSIKQIMTAKKKPIESIDAQVPPAALEIIALDPPAPRKAGRIVGTGMAAVPELAAILRREAGL